MSNKMLVDAIHPEETRVVVVRDKKVEDFDFEAASRKPLRGNIYLAKVIRVEPSLQAAFVDYGGNRHGFLAFSEIHPDYYQIPQADRAALLEYEREEAREEEDEEPKPRRSRSRRSSRSRSKETASADAAPADATTDEEAPASDAAVTEVDGTDEPAAPEAIAADDAPDAPAESAAPADDASAEIAAEPAADADAPSEPATSEPEAAAATDAPTDAATEDAPTETDAPASEAPVEAATAEEVTASADTKAEPAGDPAPAPASEAADAETAAASDEPAAPAEAATEAAAVETAPAEPAEGADAAAAEKTEEKPKPKRRRRTTTKSSTKTATTKKSDDGLDQPTLVERAPEDDADGADTDSDPSADSEADATVTAVGNADALEEIPERRRPPRRNYKIQDVIKRRQILLVQVVKEERGTKGAALTTYLSLAGRYSVLMPNTDRGGGVSRKITDSADRKRLKSLVAELDVPDGMGIILRTAGAARTKTEIKRDFEYLIRLWESVRDLTLKSIAPSLVYEEGSLVKRAIRDIYSKEIDEVLVSGDTAYREAKDFMKMLTPSHAKNVKPYREPTPIFTAYQIEPQLDAMFSPQVTLPSKGYIVINPTEALVAIDVNSGRSTKESNIEDTALKTNLEAADEVARQLRLRDLAGLIVIDFIDMDEKRHNRAVEKRLKDALKLDRSRIQVGRISPFGLLEMSRQRIRQGMVETSQVPCPACAGTGLVRSTQSVALYCLRSLEEQLLKNANNHVTLRTSSAVALYILNQKRDHLRELEARFQLEISIDADESIGGNLMDIITGAPVDRTPGDEVPTTQLSPDAIVTDEAEAADTNGASADGDGDGGSGRSSRRRRRRRRRGGSDGDARSETADAVAESTDEAAPEDQDSEEVTAADGEDEAAGNEDGSRRRRRGRRGGRRHRREGEAEETVAAADGDTAADANGVAADGPATDEPAAEPIAIEITDGAAEEPAGADALADETPAEEPAGSEAPVVATTQSDEAATGEALVAQPDPAPEDDAEIATDEAGEASEDDATSAEAAPETKSEPRERRVGWWQRRSFF